MPPSNASAPATSSSPSNGRKTDSPNGAIKSRTELKAFFGNGRLPDQTAFAYLIDSLVHQNDLWAKSVNGNGANGSHTHRITSLNRSWYVYVDSQNNLVVSESDAVRLRLNANDRVDIGGPDAPFALQVNGWTGIGMRIGSYIPADLKASPVGRDCLKVAESYLLGQGWVDAATLSDWRRATVQQVEEGVAKVQREAPPDPYKEDWSALASKHLSEGVDLNS